MILRAHRAARRTGAAQRAAALPLCALALLLSSAALADAPIRRFALVAGNDEGGPGTRPLLYARDDATKLHDILTRLGGVHRDDAELVLNGTAEDFLRALLAVERKAQQAQRQGQRTALFVYYSGHARDGALLLGDTRLPFDALKNRLAQAPADVRVGIFDACQSGALTRRKGARRAPEFDIQSDVSQLARGLIILTSSASDEDSQESDLIGGSYFSHHLASGLLGDADRSRDGRVSLSEAYAYAYERTVADTSSSAAGAQHPTYSYDFQGNGDLVLTDLVDRREGLAFPATAPSGVYYVVDDRGFVVAEVWKDDQAERRIGLPPGSYRLKRRVDGGLRLGEVSVGGGKLTWVHERSFRDAPFSDDPVKGAGPGQRVTVALEGQYQSFFDRAAREELFPAAGMLGLSLEVDGFFRRDWGWGFDLALGGGQRVLTLEGLPQPLAYDYSQLTAGTTISARWPQGRWVPWVGGRLALQVMSRRFEDPALPQQLFMTLSPGVAGGLGFKVTRAWGVGVRGRVHYLLYNVDQNRSLGYWELAASVGYAL